MGMEREMSEEDYVSCSADESLVRSDRKSPKYSNASKFSRRRPENGSMLKKAQEMNGMEIHLARDVDGELGFPSVVVKTRQSRNDLDIPLASYCKRNVSVSRNSEDDCDLISMKRRKTFGSPAKANKSSLQVSIPNGGEVEVTDEAASLPGILEETGQGQGMIGNSKEIVQIDDSSDQSRDVPMPQNKRKKKRPSTNEDSAPEENADFSNSRSRNDRILIHEQVRDLEPRRKKIRVISNELGLSAGGSRRGKSIAVLHETLRKKGTVVQKGCNVKQGKKVTTKVKKSVVRVKIGKKSRTPSPGVRAEFLLSSTCAPSDSVRGEEESTTKRSVLSGLIDKGKVVENEKVRYKHWKDGHCMLEGCVTREGILCSCCKKVVTLSAFEAHAGSKQHRPAKNIYLDNGLSLSVCQGDVQRGKTQTDSQQLATYSGSAIDQSDDNCGFCGDGGSLILCDHCPSAYHLTCMGLHEIPEGDWYCPNCRCGTCGGSEFNADRTTFNDLTVIFCEQCEMEHHVKCLRGRGLVLDKIPEGDFFCGNSCKSIFHGLRSLVGVCTEIDEDFSWTLMRSAADDIPKPGFVFSPLTTAEHENKLAMALGVMQECFVPMIDPRTKIDTITHIVYNRRSEISRLNYHGFYTIVLESGDELISVATIRVHGQSLAEMPLIGTRFDYRRKGMCRRLMCALEEMLRSMGVERLVLPAVADLLDTWIGGFGFKPMSERERLELMDMNIIAFPGTSTLQKWLGKAEPGDYKPVRRAIRQSTHGEVIRQRLQPKNSGMSSKLSPSATTKRGRGRPPKNRLENVAFSDTNMSLQKVGGHRCGVESAVASVIRNTGIPVGEVSTLCWLGSSGEGTAQIQTITAQQTGFKAFALENPETDIPSLESPPSGSIATIERKTKHFPYNRREHLSKLQRKDSERAFVDEAAERYVDDEVELEPMTEVQDEEAYVSVPIRTFPSRFGSRGGSNIPPGTFIPVETIVVNTF